MTPGEITILTFYNGQRKLIMRKLRERHLRGTKFNVVTVDSYQGEENDVVLLSLVRSNGHGNIGFLEVENRICVAISRARRGFYIFGDAPMLCKSSMLWWHIIQAMAKDPCRVGFYLHLTCKKHNEKTFIKEPEDFNSLDGGCARPCREEMPCGHTCLLGCHPFSHDAVSCKKRCNRRLECGYVPPPRLVIHWRRIPIPRMFRQRNDLSAPQMRLIFLSFSQKNNADSEICVKSSLYRGLLSPLQIELRLRQRFRAGRLRCSVGGIP